MALKTAQIVTFSLTLLGLVLTGCTQLIATRHAPPCADDACAAPGFVYSLPKGQVLLQASRKPAPPQDFAAATAAVASANDAVKKSQATLDAAVKKLADDIDKKQSEDIITADKKARTNAEAALKTDQELLDIAKATLERQRQMQSRGVESAVLTLQPVVPDPRARYVTDLAHSPFRDDTLKLTANNGLLTLVTTTSTDQTLTSFVKLAEAAISVATFASSGIPIAPGGKVAAAEVTPFPIECAYEIAEVFDPLDDKDVGRVRDILYENNANLTLEVTPAASVDAASAPSDAPPAGLRYRVATPVVVTLKPLDGSAKDWSANDNDLCPLQAKPGAQAILATVPDSRFDYAISATAGAFTTTQLSYGFSSGMLTDFTASRPSEVAALAEIPIKLAQDVIAIPGSILKLRLDYATKSSDLVKAQTTLLNAQSDRAVAGLNAQKALDEARASLIK